jgi:excisionase family DNA binding protein
MEIAFSPGNHYTLQIDPRDRGLPRTLSADSLLRRIDGHVIQSAHSEKGTFMTARNAPIAGNPNSIRSLAKPIWVTPSEAIRLSGIGRTRLYELLADGTLKSIKLRGKRLISFASIEALGEPSHD